MKRILVLAAVTAGAVIGFAGQAKAYDNCREYRETRSINGFYETGYATVCDGGRGEWFITRLDGPVVMHTPLIETVKRNVFSFGGARVTLSSTSYQPAYNYRPAYVYQPRHGGFVTPHRNGYTVRYYEPKKDKHWKHDKHHKHDKWDRHDYHKHHDDHDHDRRHRR